MTETSCRACHNYRHDDRYRRKWDGRPQAHEEAQRAALPCRHLGPETGTRKLCPSCQGHVEIKLRHCGVHGECSPGRAIPGLACCLDCSDRETQPPAGDQPYGVVLGSYGDPTIVELQLRTIRHYCGPVPILVADDTPEGPELARLEALEGEYADVTVWPNPQRRGHYAGDLSSFWKALQWGHVRGLQAVAKLSKRFLALKARWLQEGAEAMLAAGAAVSSQSCTDRGLGYPVQLYIRSEAVLLDVARWQPYYRLFDRYELGEATELYLWDLIVKHFGGQLHPWGLFDHERNYPQPDVLWHCSHGDADYHACAARFGLTLGPEFSAGPAQHHPHYKKG